MPSSKRSATPFKRISFSTTLASSAKEKTDHTKKADVNQKTTTTTDRCPLNIDSFANATTTSCSSSNSSCQNSPVERDGSGQVRSPTSLGGEPNDNCRQLVVQLVENGKVAEAMDKINKIAAAKVFGIVQDFRDGQQSNEDSKTTAKKMRLDKPESLQASHSSSTYSCLNIREAIGCTASSSELSTISSNRRVIIEEDLEKEGTVLKDLSHKMENSGKNSPLFQQTKEQIDAALLLLCTHEDEKQLLESKHCLDLAADLRSAIKSYK
uniref:Uncharacterized protein n=1 Tax=Ditylenchus dipsaci TaxID=166011 RepID=A0A915DKJ8_9BILA